MTTDYAIRLKPDDGCQFGETAMTPDGVVKNAGVMTGKGHAEPWH